MPAPSTSGALRIGVAIDDANDWFIAEILADLRLRHTVETFKPPTGRGLRDRRDRRAFDRLAARSDVLLFEWAGPILVDASRRGPRRPTVTRLQSYELYEWAPKVEWDAVDRVILVSRAMQRRFADRFPSAADRSVVVANGVNLERFQPPRRRDYARRIGMMCALVPIKRVYEMVLTVHRLRARGLDFRLSLAGPPGPGHEYRYAVAIEHAVRELGLSDVVDLRGRVEDTPAWYRDIDVFVSNSYWEGAPVSLMEAAASGCFSLSHSWAGADEMLPADQIFTSEDELVAKLLAYDEASETSRLAQQQTMRAHAVQAFDIHKVASRLEQVLCDTAQITNPGRRRSNALVPAEFWRAQWERLPAVRGFRYFDEVAQHLPTDVGGSFLEIGCGPGGILAEFCARLGYVAHGVDYVGDPDRVERWLRLQGVSVGRIHKADFLTWEPGQSYDVVGSFGFIEHFRDAEAIVDRHFRLVRPGGHVVLTVPHLAGGQRLLHWLFNRHSLQRHNVRCTTLPFLQAAAGRNGAILKAAHFVGGRFDFWPDPARQRSPMMRTATRAVTAPLRWAAARLPEGTNRWFSPYLIAIYQTPQVP
jgi:glycosyltransferase involved in cell wall biosynthesis/SAM-dependent methyltransferase